MNEYNVGPQDTCIQCGETKAVIQKSQQRGQAHAIYCAIVDYWGECTHDWDRHKFTWTHKDQDRADAENAHWEALYRAEEEKEEAMNPAPKNETIKVTSAVGADNPAEPAPSADEHRAAAIAAKHAAQAKNPEPASVGRDRLDQAMKEAFPRSTQYRPAQDETPIAGSGES